MRTETRTFLADFLHGAGHRRARNFMESFRAWAHAHSFLKIAPDHFCYKCRDSQEYEKIRGHFEESSRFIHQSIISGRRIAVIGLSEPIRTPIGDLRVLELSDRKPAGNDVSGYDHVEIYPTVGGIDELAAKLNLYGRGTSAGAADFRAEAFVKKERPHHSTWDARVAFDPLRVDRQDFILRLTEGPLVEKIAKEML